MQVPINQDIDAYKSDFFKGLSLRETVYSIIGLVTGVVCIGTMVYAADIPIQIASMIGIPIVFAVAINGYYRKNGMTFYEMIKRKIRIMKTPAYTIKEPDIRDYKISLMEQELNARKGEKKRGKKKTKGV